jgi:hypothetical protein
MQEWEYRTYYIKVGVLNDNIDTLQTALSRYGLGGWELVALTAQPNHPAGYVAIFKRPKPSRR